MVGTAVRRMTLDEFLAWDDGTDARYELVDGQVVAMAPPLVAHGMIVANLAHQLRARLRPGYRAIAEAGILPAHGRDSWYQADLVVTCAEQPPGARWVHEPSLVVEVLSPSTTGHDYETKAPDYRALASVHEVLLVSAQRRHIVLLRREAEHWGIVDFIGDATVKLEVLTAPLALADVYDGVAGV